MQQHLQVTLEASQSTLQSAHGCVRHDETVLLRAPVVDVLSSFLGFLPQQAMIPICLFEMAWTSLCSSVCSSWEMRCVRMRACKEASFTATVLALNERTF